MMITQNRAGRDERRIETRVLIIKRFGKVHKTKWVAHSNFFNDVVIAYIKQMKKFNLLVLMTKDNEQQHEKMEPQKGEL